MDKAFKKQVILKLLEHPPNDKVKNIKDYVDRINIIADLLVEKIELEEIK